MTHLYLEAACGCNLGKVRTNNEDQFYFIGQSLAKENHGLKTTLVSAQTLNHSACFAVFDGMGGEENGEEASFLAVQTLQQQFALLARDSAQVTPGQFLAAVCQTANERICAASDQHGGVDMGTTAVLFHVAGKAGLICNIGDSRAYRLRANEWQQLTVDHTDHAFLKQQGITGRRPRLTQHLGIRPDDLRIEPHLGDTDLCDLDQYLLCSDGLTDMLSDAEICRILQQYPNSKTCVEHLINRALENGGRDNITVILVRIHRAT